LEDFFLEKQISQLVTFIVVVVVVVVVVVGSGNSYSYLLLHFSCYIISITHPLFCYCLSYPKTAKKFSSLMDVKPTANQVSATVAMEGMSARRIWGRVSVCLGN
jgi:hypothetical protein